MKSKLMKQIITFSFALSFTACALMALFSIPIGMIMSIAMVDAGEETVTAIIKGIAIFASLGFGGALICLVLWVVSCYINDSNSTN